MLGGVERKYLHKTDHNQKQILFTVRKISVPGQYCGENQENSIGDEASRCPSIQENKSLFLVFLVEEIPDLVVGSCL